MKCVIKAFKYASLSFFLFHTIIYGSHAQDASDIFDLGTPSVQGVIPPSPSVAGFGKYVDMPVSHFTGIPQILIPLFNLMEGEISLPVSLSYHTSGLQVEEIAGWVGTGWTIHAGGSISRVVRGLPDEEVYGFNNMYPELNKESYDDVRDHQLLMHLAKGFFDGEPDLFYFNINGLSGKFFIHPEEGAVTIPFQKIEITPYYDQYGISQFRIRTSEGMQYYFGKYYSDEYQDWVDGCEFTEVQMKGPNEEKFRSAWHLMEIISPDRSDKIVFKYQGHYLSYDVRFSETEYLTTDNYPPCAISGSGKTISGSQIIHDEAKKISEIVFSHGSLEFVSSGNREDLYTGKKLDEILLKTSEEILVRSQKLYYSYFEAGTDVSSNELFNYRLRLDSVQEISPDYQMPPYRFTYNNDNIPARDSNGQDHWGYYNGKNEFEDTILPAVENYDGADRDACGNCSKGGSIEKVIYPTGGYTEFDFEPNSITTTEMIHSSIVTHTVSALSDGSLDWVVDSESFTNNGPNQTAFVRIKINFEAGMAPHTPYVILEDLTTGESQTFRNTMWHEPYEYLLHEDHNYKISAHVQGEVGVEAEAMISFEQLLDEPIEKQVTTTIGGLRIKNIRSYDNLNDLPALDKSFTYDEARVLSYPRYTYYQTIWKDDNDSESEYIIPCKQKPCEYLIRTSSNRSLLGTGGSPIVYPKVSEYNGPEGKGGKIEYRYSFEMDWGVNGFPFPPPTSNDWQRGLLQEKIIYKYEPDSDNYQIVKKTQIDYNDYKLDKRNFTSLKGLKVGFNFIGKNCIEDSISDLSGIFEKTSFLMRSAWIIQGAFTDKEYGNYDSSHLITSRKAFLYDNPEHAQISKILTYTDSLTIHGTQILYSGDFETRYGSLTSNHILSVPVEQRKFIVKFPFTDTLITDINRIDYDIEEPFIGKPTARQTMDIDIPITANSLTSAIFPKDSFRITHVYKYDHTDRNLMKISSYNQPDQSILWGYDKKFPIVEVNNCTEDRVAYTSFEEKGNDQGNWHFILNQETTGYIGMNSYRLTTGYNISTNIDTLGDFKLQFYHSGENEVIVNAGGKLIDPVTKFDLDNQWELIQYRIKTDQAPLPVVISGDGLIDDLRLHPVNARVVTYTYDPLKGITSIADQNGLATFYEYDNFGRLTMIRNHRKEILQQFKYFYYEDID
ncbi:hypothetical protein ACFLU5_03935 [Bacteroidota bacterium]